LRHRMLSDPFRRKDKGEISNGELPRVHAWLWMI
jgi:hypothetical protein